MRRKFLFLVADGMGGWPGELDGATALEAAHTPAMDALAASGVTGTARTIPQGMPPGSDVANMALLGFDPARHHTGRGPIGRHPRVRTRMAVVPQGKPAVTHYRPLETFAEATLVECRLETGRTHQIRVHLAHLGFPLLGDPLYAPRAVAARFSRQALHARRLALVHPASGEPCRWESPLPEDMTRLLEILRGEKR